MLTVRNTTLFSLAIQLSAFLFSGYSLGLPLKPQDTQLRFISLLETIVQLIEFLFYLRFALFPPTYANMAIIRYFDWFFTTPTMLLSMILYYHYLANQEGFSSNVIWDLQNNDYKPTWDFLNENKYDILEILFYNAMMLLMGFLHEIGVAPLWFTNTAGFIFFFMAFYKVYQLYVTKSPRYHVVFWVTFFIWSLYGVAATFPNKRKNIWYNLLDIVAKNFYGVFLAFVILFKSQPQPQLQSQLQSQSQS
jgi:bacteriorhodopsin